MATVRITAMVATVAAAAAAAAMAAAAAATAVAAVAAAVVTAVATRLRLRAVGRAVEDVDRRWATVSIGNAACARVATTVDSSTLDPLGRQGRRATSNTGGNTKIERRWTRRMRRCRCGNVGAEPGC